MSDTKIETLVNLPIDLQQSLDSGNCVLFIGAGVGEYLRKPDGVCLPCAAELAAGIAVHFEVNAEGSSDLAKIAQIVELRKKGRKELYGFLQERLSPVTPDASMCWLFSRPWRAIYTTNYDDGIERAYDLNKNPVQTPIVATVTADMKATNPMFEVPLIHLHGRLFGSTSPHIIITEDDYTHFRERRRMLFELLKKDFVTSTILYIGYSHNDTNWKLLLNELISDLGDSPRPRSYRIAPRTPALDVELLKAKGIETLSISLDDFVQAATSELGDATTSMEQFKRIESSVPSNLQPHFEANAAPVARLLKSWTYVNQARFSDKSNIKAFLHGDQPNWALIANHEFFERDIEEEIYDSLLDYATESSRKPRALAVLGPAGYGTSTLTRSLATRLVQDNAGPIFWHTTGTPILEGDILFAASLFPEQRPYFFVDNAADVSGAVLDSMSRLRDAPAPALFVLGERLNEWRVGKGRLHAQEHLIEPLSDPEINRLLDFLEKHGELNSLEPLSPELRFAAVKKIHQKELLVAMREATEDNTFDAILEDEFLSLASEIAKRVYLIVCCFYQHGALLRDSLLSDLVGLPLAELHAFTGDATEGVVVYEELDPIQGTWVVRARHRTIAKIVWERCGDILHKEALIVQCLSALNLNHYTDANAFEQFIRSDNFIDGIRTLEGKTRFFDKAIEKDPDSPYVRQHYARMLTRVDRPELALSQIQKGLELDSSIKVLYHTQGVILSRLAIASPSLDIARRRMVQAENAFRRGINIYAKDEYSYASLAELYLEWATKVPAESADYVSKCEATISEALRVVSSKEHLWIVSSKVNDLLGNEPGRIGDLERAVREQTSAVYPRFLLARVYRESGEPQKAIDILDPVFREHPDEFRLSLEYARALDDLGRPYNVPLAIMSLGTLYGLRDARFIATYGGMLFMNKDFTEASKIFAETTKRDFSTFDGRAVHYRPKRKDDPTKAIRLSGRVVEIKAGYGFIEVPGYPTFYCPSSKQRGIKLQRKMTIEFEACFSARGAVADRLVDPHRGTPHKRPV